MLFLPAIKGRYAVGVTTLVTPVQRPRPIGNAKVKRTTGKGVEELEPALFLEEVAYTVYYPAVITSKGVSAKKGVDWFVRPLRESLNGFAQFLGFSPWLLWPIVYLFGSFIKIPAYPNAPLLHPKKAEVKTDKWPLVIFSHGLGGSRTAYSQLCCRLAASGRVILAVEHRDGTGQVSMPRSWHTDGNKSVPRTLLYIKESDIHWDDSDSIQSQPFPLRAEQLAFRHHEVHITYNTFYQLIHRDPRVQLGSIDGSPFDRASWSPDGEPLVNCDKDIVLGGHSFGGCTVLSMLSTHPPDEYLPLPVERAIVLDPWLEPLPAPGPVPLSLANPRERLHGSSKDASSGELVNLQVDSVKTSLEGEGAIQPGTAFEPPVSPHPRMLVINSETFTLWKDHFARLQEAVKGWEPSGRSILTLVGSKHTSFSDFPILPIFSSGASRRIFDNIANLSVAFLDNRLEDELEHTNTTKMEVKVIGVKKDGKPKRKLIGTPGAVIVD